MLDPAGPLTSIVCPAARMLSGEHGCPLVQVNVRPSALTVAPGVNPALASAFAE